MIRSVFIGSFAEALAAMRVKSYGAQSDLTKNKYWRLNASRCSNSIIGFELMQHCLIAGSS
jgi:hypothetical protein